MISLFIDAEKNDDIQLVVLKGLGPHFSAGADLAWMQRMIDYNETENFNDAMILARTLHTLYHFKKPTVAIAHGKTFGGGIGLLAACDVVFAAEQATFCFSEVSLGLIPAVISPYVVQAMGRASTYWMMSGEPFDANTALSLQLVHQVIADDALNVVTEAWIKKILHYPPQAIKDIKSLVRMVSNQPIDESLIERTALLIAKKRVSDEAQWGIKTFLNRHTKR